jgi:hypothetical protein
MDYLSLELIRQAPGILYSFACILAAFFFPLAMLNGIKAYCAAQTANKRKDEQPR